MEIKELKKQLSLDLSKHYLGSHIMDHFRFITEDSKRTGAFGDPKYVPFYYYLGKYIFPQHVLEMGFGLGMLSGAFFKASLPEYFLAFQRKTSEYYSLRLGRKNVRDSYKGDMDIVVADWDDFDFQNMLISRPWDLVIMNEEINYDDKMNCLDAVWPQMSLGGYVVVESTRSHDPTKSAFESFCKIQNREPAFFNTRYGVGIAQK